LWVRESKSGRNFPGEVARRERPSPVLAMNPVRLLLVLVGAGSSASAAPSRISPGRLWCFSSNHAVLVTLLLAHANYSRRSLNSQPMRFPTHTQEQESKIHACAIFIFGVYWMSHLFQCISPLHENRKVLPSSCETARLQHPAACRNVTHFFFELGVFIYC